MAIDPDSGAIAVFSDGFVTVLELSELGKYVRKVAKKIDAAKGARAAVVAFSGATLLLALPDGRVLLFDAADLALKHELRPEGDTLRRVSPPHPRDGALVLSPVPQSPLVVI